MATMEPYRKKRGSLNPADATNNRMAGQVWDPALMAFRPQRFSLASSKSSMTWDELESAPATQRSSISSYASLGSEPSNYSFAHTTATSLGSRRSSFTGQARSRSRGPRPPTFTNLPPEIYECIIQQLRYSHFEPSSQSCATCYARDLYSLALTSRGWDRAVRIQLYDKIHIVGHDSPIHVKKYKMKTGVRLKLLRRTLRERRKLAQYVHELKVPNLQSDIGVFSNEMIDLVASVVMACPNLQSLIGFYTIYNHEYDRLTYALSTRRQLKEHVWIIGDNEAISQRSRKQLPPGLMDIDQVHSFLHFHQSWKSLSTLLLHSHNQGVLEHEVFVEIFHRLPSLQHLCISNFDVDDFNDSTLEALPSLRSLRLQDLHGVTDRGLSRYASAPVAKDVTKLCLINLTIDSLMVISKLLANLRKLTRFTLVQDISPEVLPGSILFQPVIASPQLEFIHWDISVPGSATENLAGSIQAGGFPNLRTIRAPSDHQGVLQDTCRPRAQIVLPKDKFSNVHKDIRASDPERFVRTLYAARQAAQERIEEARKSIQFKVVVEENGCVRQIYDFSGFKGTIGSKICYILKPDIPGSDNAVVDFVDLVDGTKETGVKDACSGLWNASHPVGKKWWYHTERHRYQVIDLKGFF